MLWQSYVLVPVHLDGHWTLVIVCSPGATSSAVEADNVQTPYLLHLDALGNELGRHDTSAS